MDDIQNEANQITITDATDNISESIVSEYYSYNKQLHQAKVTVAREVCKPTNILPFLNRWVYTSAYTTNMYYNIYIIQCAYILHNIIIYSTYLLHIHSILYRILPIPT